MIRRHSLLGSSAVPVPTDAIHEWLFSNNLLDTGSVGYNLTQSSGVLGDIIATDRHGNANSAMKSTNSAIYLSCTTINVAKGWSFNWWQNMDSNSNSNILYNNLIARYMRINNTGGNQLFEFRPYAGTTISMLCSDIATGAWQNYHVNYGNGDVDVYIDGVYQNTGDNTDHTTPLPANRILCFNTGSDTLTAKDDFRIFNRLLSLPEIQALAAA